ncbi:MAG: hypothetical protein JXO51_04825 [Candidatus Aminicenantes bacterium]|nr:hypothetical protein [Candidatus Aminicenantes bacterium]
MSGRTAGAGPGRPRRAWPLLFLLVLASVSLLLHLEKAHRSGEIRKARERTAALADGMDLERVKARRARYYRVRHFLGHGAKSAMSAAGFLERLEELFRPGRLLAVRLEPGALDFTFQLTVGVDAGTPATALWAFVSALEELRRLPGTAWATFAERGTDGAMPRRYLFTVDGQAEWP